MESNDIAKHIENPSFVINLLRDQTNYIKSTADAFVSKGQILLEMIDQYCNTYNYKLSNARSNYIELKMGIITAFSLINDIEVGEGRLRSGEIEKDMRLSRIELEMDPKSLYPGFEISHDYALAFLDKLKDKSDKRIENIASTIDLIPDIVIPKNDLEQLLEMIIDIRQAVTTEFSTLIRTIFKEGLSFIEVGMNVEKSEKSKKVDGRKYETIAESFQMNMSILEYKMCLIIQSWLKKFKEEIQVPLSQLFAHSNNSVAISKDETMIKDDICHLNQIVNKVFFGDESFGIYGDFVEMMDEEISDNRQCKFSLFNILHEKYERYLESKFADDNAYSFEENDLKFDHFLREFSQNYKIHSPFNISYLAGLKYENFGNDNDINCVMLLDVSDSNILIF